MAVGETSRDEARPDCRRWWRLKRKSSRCECSEDYQALEREAQEVTGGLSRSFSDATEDQKRFIEFRWRKQLLFFKCRILRNRPRYYVTRGTAVIGAVIVPALIGTDVFGGGWEAGVRIAAFALSLVVAIAAALEEFVGFGKRWRLYRRAHDELKAEGWAYLQLLAPYDRSAGHAGSYDKFAERVEDIHRRYGEDYIAELAIGRPRSDASS